MEPIGEAGEIIEVQIWDVIIGYVDYRGSGSPVCDLDHHNTSCTCQADIVLHVYHVIVRRLECHRVSEIRVGDPSTLVRHDPYCIWHVGEVPVRRGRDGDC